MQGLAIAILFFVAGCSFGKEDRNGSVDANGIASGDDDVTVGVDDDDSADADDDSDDVPIESNKIEWLPSTAVPAGVPDETGRLAGFSGSICGPPWMYAGDFAVVADSLWITDGASVIARQAGRTEYTSAELARTDEPRLYDGAGLSMADDKAIIIALKRRRVGSTAMLAVSPRDAIVEIYDAQRGRLVETLQDDSWDYVSAIRTFLCDGMLCGANGGLGDSFDRQDWLWDEVEHTLRFPALEGFDWSAIDERGVTFFDVKRRGSRLMFYIPVPDGTGTDSTWRGRMLWECSFTTDDNCPADFRLTENAPDNDTWPQHTVWAGLATTGRVWQRPDSTTLNYQPGEDDTRVELETTYPLAKFSLAGDGRLFVTVEGGRKVDDPSSGRIAWLDIETRTAREFLSDVTLRRADDGWVYVEVPTPADDDANASSICAIPLSDVE